MTKPVWSSLDKKNRIGFLKKKVIEMDKILLKMISSEIVSFKNLSYLKIPLSLSLVHWYIPRKKKKNFFIDLFSFENVFKEKNLENR